MLRQRISIRLIQFENQQYDANSDSDDNDGGSPVSNSPVGPSESEIDEMWISVESTAQFIRQAREGSISKPYQKAIQAAKTLIPDPTTLYWLLDGIITCHLSQVNKGNSTRVDSWNAMLALTVDKTPYQSKFQLRQHAYSYLQLLAILPEELLPSVTSKVCREMVKPE